MFEDEKINMLKSKYRYGYKKPSAVNFAFFKIKAVMINSSMRLNKKQVMFSVRRGSEPLVAYKIGM
ncbi:hypothetical protein SAE01_24710 [Segetibacter aerophilus]|uniref:Uncharacterized protein n=1 Tax=Segetibacter aerophilus TaxID=670293 RepID=A0A512BDL1_9BACT|nr:hypothetical protein SAE01_24710 [Segetibacter aerophilus]